ncbi:hypothetical protein [Ohtaekwangia sp.]
MTSISISKKRPKDKVGNLKDLSKHPFFAKKAKEAIAFLKKNGPPSAAKK